MCDAQDVSRHAELLVTEYLASWRCTQALEAFSSSLGDRSVPSRAVSERHDAGVRRRDNAADRCGSLLEFLLRSAQQDSGCCTTSKSDANGTGGTIPHRRRSSLSSDGDSQASMGEWTKQDVSALKKAIKQTAQIEDKNERWKQIAVLLGNDKSKKQCYLKYKQLKEEQKASTSTGTSDPAKKSSRSRRRSADESVRRDDIESRSSDAVPQLGRLTMHSSQSDAASSLELNLESEKSEKVAHEDTCEDNSSAQAPTFVPVVSRSSPIASEALEMEDCDDFDAPAPSLPIKAVSTAKGTTSASVMRLSAPMSQGGVSPTAAQVSSARQLIFGSPAEAKSFNSHWEEQGFCFSEVPNLRYGLVQHEGGPCGVLAVVQAYVLRFLLQQQHPDWRNPDATSQQRALVHALAHILWQAARSDQQPPKSTLVLFQDGRNVGEKRRKFMAGALLFSASTESETRELVRTNLAQLMAPRGRGLVQFVLSVVLTRGAATITSEMDGVPGASDAGGQLIGGHDYCTQEMVNLLLCGRAASNVFDGERSLEDGSSVRLRGIPSRCTVGFLSLFEAYGYLAVGSYLKQPAFSIWVVCSESHYSVLFADPRAIQEPAIALDTRASVDLFYYDGLANQDEQIRLTVATRARPEDSRVSARHDDLVPPLNLVIQTKWPRAEVDWNGVEPLL